MKLMRMTVMTIGLKTMTVTRMKTRRMAVITIGLLTMMTVKR